MKISLPEELEPEGFRCVRVWIPDNAGYHTALMSVVSFLQSWFAWERDDNQSGSIAAAKWREAYSLTIRDILDRKTCDSCEGEDETPYSQEDLDRLISEALAMAGGCDFWPEEEEGDSLMGCNGPAIPIKWENGKLYFWHCCQWVLVEGQQGGGFEQPDDETPDEPGEGTASIACRKASALVNAIIDVAEAGWDNRTLLAALDLGTVLWMNKMNGLYSKYTLADSHLYLACNYLKAMVAAGIAGWDIALPDTLRQKLICQLVKQMDGTSSTLSTEERVAISTAIRYLVGAGPSQLYLLEITASIGDGTLATIAKEGLANEAADCGCPEEVAEPEDLPGYQETYTWYHDFDFRIDDYDFTSPDNGVYTLGAGWHSDGERSFTIEITGGTVTANVVKYLYAELQIPSGFQWDDVDNAFEWYISPTAKIQWADLGDTLISGGGTLEVFKRLSGQFADAKSARIIGEFNPLQNAAACYIKRLVIAGTGDDPWPTAPDKV